MRRTIVVVGIAVMSAAVVIVAPAVSAGGRPHARAAATTVNVTGKEFSFTLSRSSARHGSVTFRFTNKGRVKHDFSIAGRKTKVLNPKKSQSLRVTLKKGSYRYLCTVKGHAASGMKGTFRVT
jgi:plastocyanin